MKMKWSDKKIKIIAFLISFLYVVSGFISGTDRFRKELIEKEEMSDFYQYLYSFSSPISGGFFQVWFTTCYMLVVVIFVVILLLIHWFIVYKILKIISEKLG